MTNWMRGPFSAAGLTLAALALAGCSSMGGSQTNTSQLNTLNPVASSTVTSGSLPTLAGTATTAQIAPGLTGTPVLGGVQATTPLTAPGAQVAPQGTLLADIGATPRVATGRDLTTGVTTEKLLGGWTVTGGATSCRLNLTQTAKAGTTRFRASAPGCQIPSLGTTASWQLAGTQVQLFDEAGTLIAALQLSGDRFIGTVAGGTAITMTA